MKRRGLLITTCFTFFLTGMTFSQAHRSGPRGHRAAAGKAETAHAVGEYDPLSSAEARRWHQGQANHWRALLLQR